MFLNIYVILHRYRYISMTHIHTHFLHKYIQCLLCGGSSLPIGSCLDYRLQQNHDLFVNHMLPTRNHENERRPQIRSNLFFPPKVYNLTEEAKFMWKKINKYTIKPNNGCHTLGLSSVACMASGDPHKKLPDRNSYYFQLKMGSLVLREFHQLA